MLTVGWFSTGRGPGSLGLLNHVQRQILLGRLDAQIQFVFSNREPGEAEGSDRFFQRVRGYGLPLVYYSSRKARKAFRGPLAGHRLDYDRGVMSRLEGFSPDVCVLAGYMLIVGSEMCRRYTMLNLHPALPTGPVGTWQEVIWTLIESRAEATGAMVHLVTEDVDRGPLVSFFTLPIFGGAFDGPWRQVEGHSVSQLKQSPGEDLPLFSIIRREEYRREPHLLAATLDVLAKGRLQVRHGRISDASGRPADGLCLDEEIARALANSPGSEEG